MAFTLMISGLTMQIKLFETRITAWVQQVYLGQLIISHRIMFWGPTV